ncbi:DUF4189 domain-containing protein [Lysobacter capsici]|uniref:DUF4189 domain-containing protein n=1 Tax=Lysobacter capsici TaxID=435897 RepID=UPI00177A7FFB|nr:DUF4189 domain-containing protein [Lysobacter capsici]UOF13122.1 DUF4189 domain-containing protein [Lysobacter capsici]
MYQLLAIAAMLSLSGLAAAQGCPAGIPAGNNPLCIPPDNPSSPYYQSDSGASTSSSTPTVHWEDRWGAIAVDNAKDSAGIGVAVEMASQRKAKEAAMNDCRSKGGTQCEVVLAYYNQCGVLVAGNAGYTSMRAATAERAADLGLKQCVSDGLENCKVYYSGCSYPVRGR